MVCALDPDGDIVRHLRGAGSAHKAAGWACYHTDMVVTEHAGAPIGRVGCAVGAPFAVLDVADPRVRDLYGHDLLLLRPDLHIAWRGKAIEAPERLAALVTGH